MSQPIVIQLQEFASDGNHEIVNLLRKGLIVAAKLDLSDFRDWISKELEGYKAQDPVPEYRIVRGDLCCHNPYHGLIPFIIQDPRSMEVVTKAEVRDSIASLVSVVGGSKDGTVALTFSAEREAALMRMQQGEIVRFRPMLKLQVNSLVAISDAVRTRILKWALTLEKEGIVGDGFTFSDKEKETAHKSTNIRIENFLGVLGDVRGGIVNQTNTLTVAKGDLPSLVRFLEQQGIEKSDIRELEAAVKADPKPDESKDLGPRVSAWIGQMVAKAASGVWDVSLSVAGALLGAALEKYYLG